MAKRVIIEQREYGPKRELGACLVARLPAGVDVAEVLEFMRLMGWHGDPASQELLFSPEIEVTFRPAAGVSLRDGRDRLERQLGLLEKAAQSES